MWHRLSHLNHLSGLGPYVNSQKLLPPAPSIIQIEIWNILCWSPRTIPELRSRIWVTQIEWPYCPVKSLFSAFPPLLMWPFWTTSDFKSLFLCRELRVELQTYFMQRLRCLNFIKFYSLHLITFIDYHEFFIVSFFLTENICGFRQHVMIHNCARLWSILEYSPQQLWKGDRSLTQRSHRYSDQVKFNFLIT